MACSGRVIEINTFVEFSLSKNFQVSTYRVTSGLLQKRELDFVLLRQGNDFSHLCQQALMWFFTQRNGILVSENSLKFVGFKMWWKNVCKEILFTGFVELR